MRDAFELSESRKVFSIVRKSDGAVMVKFFRDSSPRLVQDWLGTFNQDFDNVRGRHDAGGGHRSRIEWSTSLRELKRATAESELDPYTWRGPGEEHIPLELVENLREAEIPKLPGGPRKTRSNAKKCLDDEAGESGWPD